MQQPTTRELAHRVSDGVEVGRSSGALRTIA